MLLAMADIELPLVYLGRNISLWIQAVFSSVIILGLGFDFHRGMLMQTRNLAANMDTLISLGTLAALFYSQWGMFVGIHHLYFETGAVIAALILLGRYFEARSRGQAGEAIEKLMETWRQDGARDREDQETGYSDRAGESRRSYPGQGREKRYRLMARLRARIERGRGNADCESMQSARPKATMYSARPSISVAHSG